MGSSRLIFTRLHKSPCMFTLHQLQMHITTPGAIISMTSPPAGYHLAGLSWRITSVIVEGGALSRDIRAGWKKSGCLLLLPNELSMLDLTKPFCQN